MASLGNKFQTARETQGFTVEQMVSRTRIQESYLKALEADSFGQLPERVFTKGFVRAYARSLELDEEECLRLFEECSASFYQKEKKGEGLQKIFLRKEDAQKERTSRAMVILLVGGLLLLGGMVLLQQQSPSRSIFSRFSQQPVEPRDGVLSEQGPPGNANDIAEDRPPSAIEGQVDADDSGVSNAETAPKTDVATIPAESPVDDAVSTPSLSPPDPASISSPATRSEDGPLVLELRTLEMTWIVVRSDENEPREALLQPGEIVQWQANERFLLTLGNAGGVEARLNGQLQGPFGESGVVVRDVEIRP